MRVTIKYMDLSKRLIEVMSIEQLIAVRNQIIKEFEALSEEIFEEKCLKKQLMAQVGLISGVLTEKAKSIEHLCEKCGAWTNFSGNMCEKCFDNEVDRYYDGGLDEDE